MKNAKNAKEFLQQIKKQKFSIEELKQITQINNTFIQEFANALNNEIKVNGESYKTAIDFFKTQMELLQGIIKDRDITSEERELIYKILADINDKVYNLEQNRENKNHSFKKYIANCFAFVAAFFGLIIIILTGGQNREK